MYFIYTIVMVICKIWMQLSEYEIIEIAENVCNLKKREADWILKIDIVENGDKLEVKQGTFEMFYRIIWGTFAYNLFLFSLLSKTPRGNVIQNAKQ